jgi:YebC/PmpR family DNA-binding regulatory protein
MHRKGAQDAARSGQFTKLAREITMAAKLGDMNPDNNPRLRLAIQSARKLNMPNDNIKRALDKASAIGGENYESVRYEGYGPSAVPIIVEAMTDNPRRTVPEVRSVFTKNGGNMGESGSVAFMFNRVGMIVYKKSTASEDAMFEAIIEAGAEDLDSTDENVYIITAAVDNFMASLSALQKKFGESEKAELTWIPTNPTELSDDDLAKVEKLVEALEALDDVQKVFASI